MSSLTMTGSDFDSSAFVSKAYNHTYYDDVMQDEQALIEWQAGPLDGAIRGHLARRGVRRFSRHLDAGSGPAVHHLLALEKYSDAIDLADFLPANLAEIKEWVADDPLAHDWAPFTRAVLAAEGITASVGAVARRENAVRSKIASYLPLDLKYPTPDMRRYRAPFVTSFFVADSATGDKEIFARMTSVAFGMVEPGGLFVATYLGGCAAYAVGSLWVRSAGLTRADIEQALIGSDAQDIDIRRYETPCMTPEGFDHIFAVSAGRP